MPSPDGRFEKEEQGGGTGLLRSPCPLQNTRRFQLFVGTDIPGSILVLEPGWEPEYHPIPFPFGNSWEDKGGYPPLSPNQTEQETQVTTSFTTKYNNFAY